MNEQNVILEEDGFEEEIDVLEETSITMAMWGDITGNIENQTDLQNALDAKQDSLSQAQLDATNSGITSAKVAKYDGYEATINAKADQSALDAETIARGEADTALGTRIDNEVTARQTADNGLQSQIDAITSKSDVVDVVANYAALQNYDTSALGNNDVVKVLDDETHEDALTYYRWNATTRTWSYIGQEAPYYSKGQMDVFLQGKQDKLTAGNNVQIQNNVISATDTTYTAGDGLDLNGTEFSADTTVLATKTDLEGYYTKSEADTLIEPKLEVEVVDQLPTTGEEAKLYLTPKAHTEQTASGNPINLNITESAGKIDSVQIDGDTYQQSYEGKNLFNYRGANVRTGYVINDSGVEISDSTGGYTRQFSKVTPNTDYILSPLIGAGTRRVYYFDSNKSFISCSSGYISSTSIAFTTPANCYYVDFQIYTRGEQDQDDMRNWQLEAGSTATAYEPYVGGVPSPNPDYPQAIQTVTGLQTVTVNGTDYPIDLGDIELCKLDTYQDYIYKDGSEWKAYKVINKVIFDGSERWSQSSTTNTNRQVGYINAVSLSIRTGAARERALMSGFVFASSDNAYGGNFRLFNESGGVTQYLAIAINKAIAADMTEFIDWLENNNQAFYYVRNTPTDTTITDQTLIAQLEAVANASLASGAYTITNTATGSNLAGDLEISYHGFDPRNRYDKWLWLNINNEYEQLGS